MTDDIMLQISDDGKATLYESTYDITIHCESEKEQHEVMERLNSMNWIPVSERLPEEHDSIFSKFYGTDRWRKGMFRKWSEKVIVTLEFEDGARSTEAMRTVDGKWDISNYSLKATVIAWMPLPKPYGGEQK